MFLITARDNLPQQLTSYDLLKSFAVITMVIDHIGMYLFPEQNDWRAIGRLSMPVWLFLIGYAQSRELSPLLWGGGAVLVLSDFIIGNTIFPVNILFTILCARFILDFLMRGVLKSTDGMIWGVLGVTLLVIPTTFIFDYGTHAFLFAMFGYLVRHKESLSISRPFLLSFMGVAVLVHALFQNFVFEFNMSQAFIASMGILCVCLYMTNFKPHLYNPSIPCFVKSPLQIMGRYSLEIYVLHLLLFKFIAFFMFPEDYSLFQWAWY